MDIAHYSPPRRRKPPRRGRIALIIFLLAFIGTVITAGLWRWLAPNGETVIPDYGENKPIFYQGKMLDGEARGSGEQLAIPLTVIRSLIDPTMIFEDETKSVIITTKGHVVRMPSQQLGAWLNEKPFPLRFPVEQDGQEVYVPIEPLEKLYGVQFLEAEKTGIVTIRKQGDVILSAAVPEPTEIRQSDDSVTVPVRQEPTMKAPIIGKLTPGEHVDVWSEERGWYYVQLSNGYVGYVDENLLSLAGTRTIATNNLLNEQSFVPKKQLGERIVLAWEQVYTKTPDPNKLGPMPALNVVSPTWFHLLDGQGALENRVDAAYVKWAHKQGHLVWALFSNRFDPALTSEALSTYDRRMTMARQLISWVQMYELDGINIDFENVNMEDGPKLTQFVRELTPLLHEAGVTVSIDVTLVSSSENWSLFYDRKALASVVDYMMLMAYDEHWANSPTSGSVASLPWVENGIVQLLDEYGVPSQKVILGVPFYTRLWTEQTVDGKLKVSSKALGMDSVQKIIVEKKLTPKLDQETGQNYVEYEENGALNKIWLEDETSMKARIDLLLKYRLGGVAAWSRSFANESIWGTIDSAMKSFP